MSRFFHQLPLVAPGGNDMLINDIPSKIVRSFTKIYFYSALTKHNSD